MLIQKADFYKTWSRVITRAISLCYKEMDEDFVEKTKVSLMDLEVYAENLYSVVKRKERWLREEYLPKHKPNKDKSSLDVHKISSIFCRSIIGCKPFSYDMSVAKKELERIHKEENISQPDKIKWEIDNIYVVNGPGSFTGIRVGVATVNAFAYANSKKVVAITTFEPFAYDKQSDEYAIDAKHGNYYLAKRVGEKLEYETMEGGELSPNACVLSVTEVSADNLLKIAEEKINSGEIYDMIKPFYMRASEAERNKK